MKLALPVKLNNHVGKRRSKFGAVPTIVNNIRFASKLEAKRYTELRALEATGEIHNLELQPVYKLTICGVDCGKLIFDFQYFTRATNAKRGESIIEETKGFRTPLYRFKLKVFHALYPGRNVIEVRK